MKDFLNSRKGKITTGVSLGVILVLLATITFLPKYVGRYVIADQLETMGLVQQGVETLEIDLWNSEVNFGPVQVGWQGDSNPIILDVMSLQYDLSEIFNKRILFTKAIFRNLDIRFDRLEDGSFAINQIPLKTFLPPADDSVEEVSDEIQWHAGIDDFALEDSHLYFEDFTGENVTFTIDNLDLASFRTWEPDLQGSFELAGALNEIGVKMDGTAQLFSSRIKIKLQERFSEIGVSKIERATGPLGFTKNLGIVNAGLSHEIDIFPEGDLKLKTGGELEVIGLSLEHELGFIGEWEKGTITFSSDLETDPQQKGNATADFKVVGQDFKMSMEGKALMSADTLTFEGKDIAAPIDLALTPSFTGNFNVKGETIVAMVTGLVNTTARQLSLNLNDVDVELDGAISASASGDINMRDFNTTLPKSETAPAVDAVLSGLDFSFAGGAKAPSDGVPVWNASITGGLSGVDLSIANGEAMKMSLASAELTKMEANSSILLAGDAILLKDMKLHVTDKLIYGGKSSDTDTHEAPTSENADVEPTIEDMKDAKKVVKGINLPFDFRLGRFAILDGAVLSINDASVTPAVEADVKITELEVKNMDNMAPDKIVDFTLAALVNEFTNLAASGQGKLFTDNPFVDAKLDMKGLQLHPVSPYAAKHAGMHLNNGHMSMQATGTARDGQLKSEIKLDIKALEFEALTPEDKERLSAAAGIPIDTAVGLLEDSDGRIELTIPIEGDLTNPDINIDQIINKAIGGAVQAAAAGAFKLLFPPALLVSLIADADDGSVGFKPIEFNAGAELVNEAGATNIESLAVLMAERPKLAITICGRATQADFKQQFDKLRYARIAEIEAKMTAGTSVASDVEVAEEAVPLDQELKSAVLSGDDLVEIRERARNDNVALAETRTLAVKRVLVNDHGIDAIRINECRATEDPAAEITPHVAVSL